MPGTASDGGHQIGCIPVASNDGPEESKVLRGRRAMAVWTALLLGALSGMAMLFASSTLRVTRANTRALGQARQDQEGRTRTSFRASSTGAARLEVTQQGDHPAVLPRILTVLTTYDMRSALIKEYKQAVLDREDGYHPEIFAVSNLDDEDFYDVIDFKVGSSGHHRSIAAIAEATSRYAGTFDWIALGDDDTAFMYNRAMNFLSHIDHTKPVVFGRVDGLNSTGRPVKLSSCYSPEEKRTPTNQLAANGCCQDYASPCEVPVFPPDVDMIRTDTLSDYGPNGLHWGYGGSGIFMSAGLVVDVVGAEGWALCERMFVRMNTDVQIGQCFKMHGYSMGAYPQGFGQIGKQDSFDIRRYLAYNCELLGFHLAVSHLGNRRPYTPETFRAAVAAVRDADVLSARDGEDPTSRCYESLASFPK